MSQSSLLFTPWEKALLSLQRALAQPKDEYTRDAVAQRFKYTYERTWKMLRRYLAEETGVKEFNIKNIYREAARQHVIDNPEKWFAYHTTRNLTPHTYNEDPAEETYNTARLFLVDAENLCITLKKACGFTTE